MNRTNVSVIVFLLFSFTQVAVSQNKAIQPSVVVWGFRYPFDQLCKVAKQNNIFTVELLPPEKWDKAKQNGLQVLIANGADMGIERGFCNPDFHTLLQEQYIRLIPQAAENGIQMVICYSGINPNISPEEAMRNCIEGLKPVIQCAEKNNILIVMKLISSRQSEFAWWQHTFPHYVCDNIAWGAALADKIASSNFKLIYDIWQMDNMGADIVSDIQKYNKYIALYHISGKDRKGIRPDDPIDYKRIITAIRKTGYTGYIGLEFLIEKNIPESIRQASLIIN